MLSRRRTLHTSIWAFAAMVIGTAAAQTRPAAPGAPGTSAGTWPGPRQNRQLTAIQPLAGRMREAPQVVTRLAFPGGQAALHPFASRPGGAPDRAAAIVDGRLRCSDLEGKLLWDIHPPGLNFENLTSAEDLDGDGRVDLLLSAGRPKSPLGAAVVVDAGTGQLRFRYDVEPMSYSWIIRVGAFLPETAAKQFAVIMHGYPPDKKNGYIALFEFPKPGEKPRQRWRYDFSEYTCFPTLLTSDVDGDRVKELCVQTHSRMWVLDARTGALRQFVKWDVAPANVRSYGLVRFQDLNGDGREDFLCIANFAQHHEVLLNEDGRLKQAWAHGWDDSVTTRTVATVWAEPPIADVDGDGKAEMVLSMFRADGEPKWAVRIYDAVTGVLKGKIPDRVAAATGDLDGDGAAEILAEVTTDPTRTTVTGACLLKQKAGDWKEVWREEGARPAEIQAGTRQASGENDADSLLVRTAGGTRRLAWKEGGARLEAWQAPPHSGPDLSRVRAAVGARLQPPLVADVDGDGANEVLHLHAGKVTLYRYRPGQGLVPGDSYPSDTLPAVADLDGDGKLEMVVGTASADSPPKLRALRPGRAGPLWEAVLTPAGPGIPHGRALYFQTGHFTGGAGDDLYVYAGTPVARSLLLDGRTGRIVWEKGAIPGSQRYYAPTVNHAAVWDVNGDRKDDLVFTNPDYYCVASGPTGDALIGPAFPPQIFSQPSQGLYTLPAVLENRKGDPTVCLVDGHYFQGVMTVKARPAWYRLPEVGEARSGAEGFMKLPNGTWLMGYGREDGHFACIDVATGKKRWELPLGGAAGAASTCDIDGDGQPEFLFGTTHGKMYAVADAGSRPRVVWTVDLPASAGTPVPADVDGDGASEILVSTGDGALCLLDVKTAKAKKATKAAKEEKARRERTKR
jgi:hypothetical protein